MVGQEQQDSATLKQRENVCAAVLRLVQATVQQNCFHSHCHVAEIGILWQFLVRVKCHEVNKLRSADRTLLA